MSLGSLQYAYKYTNDHDLEQRRSLGSSSSSSPDKNGVSQLSSKMSKLKVQREPEGAFDNARGADKGLTYAIEFLRTVEDWYLGSSDRLAEMYDDFFRQLITEFIIAPKYYNLISIPALKPPTISDHL